MWRRWLFGVQLPVRSLVYRGASNQRMGDAMGIFEDAKETISEAAKQAGRTIDDTVERVKDKADEIKADAEVKKAEAERDSVKARNDAKENLRD